MKWFLLALLLEVADGITSESTVVHNTLVTYNSIISVDLLAEANIRDGNSTDLEVPHTLQSTISVPVMGEDWNKINSDFHNMFSLKVVLNSLSSKNDFVTLARLDGFSISVRATQDSLQLKIELPGGLNYTSDIALSDTTYQNVAVVYQNTALMVHSNCCLSAIFFLPRVPFQLFENGSGVLTLSGPVEVFVFTSPY